MLESVSLLVLRIQGHPKEAISFPDTVGKTEREELDNKSYTRSLNRHQNADSHHYKRIYNGELFHNVTFSITTIHMEQQWQDKGPAGGSNTKCMGAHHHHKKSVIE